MFIYLAIAYTNLSKDMRSIMEQELNKSIVIAYYLSRRDKEGLNVLGYKTFSKAFKEIGEIIGENPNNLKNLIHFFLTKEKGGIKEILELHVRKYLINSQR